MALQPRKGNRVVLDPLVSDPGNPGRKAGQMGLMQIGTTLGIGGMELIYACDGCEAKTNDPYANIGILTMDSNGKAIDSSLDGWTFISDAPDEPCTRAYCPGCSS